VLPPGWIVRAQMPVALDDESAPYGWRYRSVETLTPTSVAVPLALRSVCLAVADLLPERHSRVAVYGQTWL